MAVLFLRKQYITYNVSGRQPTGCRPDMRSGFAVFLRRGAALPAFRRRSQFLVWMERFSTFSAASRMVSVTVG